MLIFGNMQKEGNPIGAFLAAHVAREDVVVAMVAHVNGVQDGVLERNATEFAVVRFGGRVCTVRVGCVVGMVFVVVERCIATSDRFDWCRGSRVGLLLLMIFVINVHFIL